MLAPPSFVSPNAAPGYGLHQPIPITGATPPPQGSTPNNQDPPDAPVNAWLKAQPWYQAALKAWGVDPNHPVLNTQQREQIAEAAARAGLQFGSSHDIGPEGDWEDVHTTAGKVIIGTIAGVAGGVGAAGLLAGAGGAEAAAASAPELIGTAAGPGALATAAGTAPIAAETAATVGGLSSAALPGALAAPTVADLATTGSAIAGTTLTPAGLAAVPAVTSPFSSVLNSLTSPSVLGTIASGLLTYAAANTQANASADAAKITADANLQIAQLLSQAQLDAAKLTATSTADALDFAKAGYQDEVSRYNANQAQLAPYTGAGDAAITKLSQLMGLGTPPAYVAPPPLALPPTTRPAVTPPTTPAPPPLNSGTQPPIDSAPRPPADTAPRPGTIASVASPPPAQSPQTMPLATPTQSQQPMVTLRAPTGEVEQKPAAELQHWLSLGAQQVPGTQLTAGAP